MDLGPRHRFIVTLMLPLGERNGVLYVCGGGAPVYMCVYMCVCVCARADHLSVASGPNGMNETFGNIQLSFEC